MKQIALFLCFLLILSATIGCDDAPEVVHEDDESTAPEVSDEPTEDNSQVVDGSDDSSTEPSPAAEGAPLTLPYAIAELEDTGSFMMGLIVTNVDEFLHRNPDNLTFFVPHEKPLSEQLREGELEGLYRSENHIRARKLIYHHSIEGKWSLEDLRTGNYPSGSGQQVRIERRDGEVYFDGHRVLSGDHPASNGIIHIIDGVSIPDAD